jgi:hypothetical protein
MPQTCPSCLWISSDEAEECERCGESFTGKLKSQVTPNAVGGVVTTGLGLLALIIVAVVAYQRLGDRVPNLQPTLKAAALGFYTWLLGPNEVFKPYLVIAMMVTLVVWIILWLLARFR